jgi:hypothetical protein
MIKFVGAILVSAVIIAGTALYLSAGREAARDIEALSSLPQFIAYSVRHPGQVAAYVRRGRDAAAMDHCIEKEGADSTRPMKGVSLEDFCGIFVLSIQWGF